MAHTGNKKLDPTELRSFIEKQNSALWSQLDQWLPHYRSIQKIMLPYRGRLDEQTTQNDGKERADERQDGSATRALRTLSAGMYGGLTSPSQRWFRLELQDKDVSKIFAVRVWLDTVEDIIFSHLRRSNFYTAVQNIYTEQGGFGTACLFTEEHSEGAGVWFRVVTCGDYVLATDGQGRVNTMIRRDWLTSKQLIDMFGLDRVSEGIRSSYQERPYEYHKVFQGIQPRKGFVPTKLDALNMPFVSSYWEEKNNQGFLGEGGFREFPAQCPRWDTVGSNVYGYSPGMEALPDVRGMNQVSEDLLTAVNKEVDPPVNIPDSIGEDVDLGPGGENPSVGDEKVTATYQISPNLGAGFEIKSGIKGDITEWFYTNLFVLTANPNATATEIAKKNEEQLVQLGPVIQRQFNELLTPVVERTFKVLERQGFIPPAPPELENNEIEIEYISTLAQAQKLVGVQKVERFAGFIANAAQVDPRAIDKMDGDALIDVYADGIGVPAKVLRSQEEVNNIRKSREQAQAEQAQQEQANMGAQTAATLSNAKLDDDNALTALAGGNSGQ